MKYVTVLLVVVCGYGMFASVASKSIWEIIETSNNDMFGKTKMLGRTLEGDKDSPNITHGDIAVDPDEPKAGASWEGVLGRSNNNQRQPYYNWQNKLWTTRDIPYVIDRSLSKSTAVIKDSLRQIRDALSVKDRPCLTFRRKRYTDKWWISFHAGSGCYSGIGKKYWQPKKPTKISLGYGCVVPAIIMHEVLHALGFPHEQSRRDRDSFVEIFWGRILPSMKDNFRMNEVGDTNTMGTPYDYKSIMHYTTKTFAMDPRRGNTIQRKGDPNYKLATLVLSKMDVKELRSLYMCHIPSGWSDWYGDSICNCNWMGDCQKSNVRICIGEMNCPDVNKYGTGFENKDCTKEDAARDKKRKDGFWGHWSPFSKCDSSCGWGYKKRSRKCDNPIPVGVGKVCVGRLRQRIVCRNPRCKASRFDDDFEKTRRWSMNGFSKKQSTDLRDSGPKKDHTYEGTSRRGYFAGATGQGKGTIKTATLTSPVFKASRPRCLMFHYMMDGQNINKMEVYLKASGTSGKTRSLFIRKGHQGNWWIRSALTIKKRSYGYQIVIKYTMDPWRDSIIGIDDIFVDNDACPVGLVGCRDYENDCQKRGRNGECNAGSEKGRIMVAQCCSTCQDKRYRDKKYTGKSTSGSKKKTKPKPKVIKPKKKPTACIDKPKWKCLARAKAEQCTKYAAWMKKNCCATCKKKKEEESVTKPIKTPCIDKPKWKCLARAKADQCTKYPAWMKKNCCATCKKKKGKSAKKTSVCRDKPSPALQCKDRAKYGQCTKSASKQWMTKNCCGSCKKLE